MSSQFFWNDLEDLVEKYKTQGVDIDEIISMLNEKADDMSNEPEEEEEEEEEEKEVPEDEKKEEESNK